MELELKRCSGYGVGTVLAFWLVIGAPAALAQSKTIGSVFQGTIFAPTLETVSEANAGALLSTLVVEGNYDSNLLSQAGSQLSGNFELVQGEFNYGIRRSGNDLLLSYVVGQRIYPTNPGLNSSNEDARLQWKRRITNKLDFALTQRWASLPAGAILESNPEQGFPLVGSVPQGLLFLQQKATTFQTTASLTERLTAHTIAVVGGNYVHTDRSGLSLISTQEEDAYAGMYYSPTSRQDIGVVSAVQYLTFSLGFGKSLTRSLFLSYNRTLSPTISVSVFGGPSQVLLAGSAGNNSANNLTGFPPVAQSTSQQTLTGFLGGVNIQWRLGRNKLRANYTQLISGGSGFLSTDLRKTADLNLTRAISRRMDMDVGASYSQNAQIGQANLVFKTYYIEPSLHFRLTPHLRLTMRDSVGKATGLAAIRPIIRNEAAIRLEYTFPKIPLRK